ncbi:hypothetical protein F4780DRAFT_579496 [Xylariomycetidae sp. FL0641]|nr:hypothetical protein F4780DRAFT_579496 [Xylariomycetidae sp. FL0641]
MYSTTLRLETSRRVLQGCENDEPFLILNIQRYHMVLFFFSHGGVSYLIPLTALCGTAESGHPGHLLGVSAYTRFPRTRRDVYIKAKISEHCIFCALGVSLQIPFLVFGPRWSRQAGFAFDLLLFTSEAVVVLRHFTKRDGHNLEDRNLFWQQEQAILGSCYWKSKRDIWIQVLIAIWRWRCYGDGFQPKGPDVAMVGLQASTLASTDTRRGVKKVFHTLSYTLSVPSVSCPVTHVFVWHHLLPALAVRASRSLI